MCSPDFEIQLVSCHWHGSGQMHTFDLANGDKLPQWFISALTNDKIIKVAHNAAFERYAFSVYLGVYLQPNAWLDTMALSAYFGLPLNLEKVGDALNIENKKLKTGKDLINFFAVPCKPTKNNYYSTRRYPFEYPEKWQAYKTYNQFDVKAECEIYTLLSSYQFPQMEQQIYVMDQHINDRGIMIDVPFAQKAYDIDKEYKGEIFKILQDKTDLQNPNSRKQVLEWLQLNCDDIEVEDLKKGTVKRLITTAENDLTRDVLENWTTIAKKSTSKYEAMLNVVDRDWRARGLTQYYGANRTGRFAGRHIQLQNLAQPTIGKDLHTDAEMVDLFRQAKFDVMQNDLSGLKNKYNDIAGLLSSLVRPTFIAPKGRSFRVADFSAIEARVLAWLAGEQWRLDVFSGDGKIYEASASRLFKVDISEVTRDSDYRKKGKVAELAFGYQGAVNAFDQMAGKDASKYTEAEKVFLVKQWRRENPAIVQFWYDIENCALQSVYNPGVIVDARKGVQFYTDANYMIVKLPSGRCLYYYKPRIGVGKYGNACVEFIASKKLKYQQTYGGKLTENLVQAIARDLLVEAMLRLEAAGYPIVMHVHDEIVAEGPVVTEQQALNTMIEIMIMRPVWGMDIPLGADGFTCDFYHK